MAPPLRRGRALVVQRLVGLLFLVVLTALVALAVALYQKAFTPTVDVVLQADRAGNQLGVGGDVKARGVLVGRIEQITPTEDGARIELALERDQVHLLPADTSARLLPKTLFGERYVALEFDDGSAAEPLTDGDVISQDSSETAREFATALDDLLPLLQTLKPDQVSTTLNALSTTLRGRGDRIGENLVLGRDYLEQINPELPVLAENFRGIADFADTLDASADDILALLDNSSAIGRNLVETEDSMAAFLAATTGFAATAEGFLEENEQRFIALARESVPNLRLYERYSPGFPCLLRGIAGVNAEGERVFGRGQPGLHITLEVTEDQGGYLPSDAPRYGEDEGPTCFGLDGEPIRPFPITVEVTDGYCDDQEEQPSIQTRCERERPSPVPSSGLALLLTGPLTGST